MKKKHLGKASGAAGAAGGVSGLPALISVSGSVPGLSAAGITSGLAALGGGSMLGGVLVIGAVPLATGAVGYGIYKGVKHLRRR